MKEIAKTFKNRKIPSAEFRMLRGFIFDALGKDTRISFTNASISQNDMSFSYDNSLNEESEFFSKYSEKIDSANAYWFAFDTKNELVASVTINYQRFKYSSDTRINIRFPQKADMFSLMSDFEESYRHAPQDLIEEDEVDLRNKSLPKVFIGHGRSQLWRDLRDHLRDMHGFSIEAYESGSRAGHTIRDIVADMASGSDIACLIHTAEDELRDGKFQTRPNVIHETGLFQGKLGFSRALVVLEEGCEEFSNLAGIQQIRFSKGNIRETFGDVLAVLKREFD